jgi:hypothetical protein
MMEKGLVSLTRAQAPPVEHVGRVEGIMMDPVQGHMQTFDVAGPSARQRDDCCFMIVRRDLCLKLTVLRSELCAAGTSAKVGGFPKRY